jgi:FXSXX-COOH protein
MMSEFSSEEPNPKGMSPLIDLGDVSLDDVARMDDSALAHSLSRILGDTANPDEVILASFSASV